MVMRPIKEKEGRERRNRRQNEGRPDGQKRKVRTTITQGKLDEMNEIFSKYQEYREVQFCLLRTTKTKIPRMKMTKATSHTKV